MQPFYLPESLGERNARLSSVAAWRAQAGTVAPAPRWRRVVGAGLVRAGNRLVAGRSGLGYSGHGARTS